MPNINDFFGSRYISGKDVGHKTFRLQIREVAVEAIEDRETGKKEDKLCVYFANAEKPLLLNATNGNALSRAWGEMTERWHGKWVEVFTVPVNFGGKMHDGVRLRPIDDPQTAPAAAPTPAPTPPLNPAEFTASPDDVPF